MQEANGDSWGWSECDDIFYLIIVVGWLSWIEHVTNEAKILST